MSEEATPARTAAVVGGLFVCSAGAGAYEIAPASVATVVGTALGGGPSTAAWLVSAMYATAVVASVPVGVAIDRVGVQRAVAAATVALGVAGGTGWVVAGDGSYGPLLATRVVGGAAYVVVWNAGATVAGQAVAPERRATAVGVFTASAPVGFALGQAGGPLVAGAVGWPAIFPAFAAVGVVGGAVFLAATVGRPSVEAETATPTAAEFRTLATNTGAWRIYGLCFLAFSLYLFLNSWLPSYLVDGLGLSLGVSGAVAALFPVVGVVSRTGSGPVSDRVFGGRRRPVLLLAFAVATPAVFAFAAVTWLPAVVGLVLAAGLAIQLAIGLLFTWIAEVVDPAVRTTAVAALTSVGLLGAFLAPIAAGLVVETAGYRTAFLLGGVVGAVGIGLAVVAPRVR